MSFASSLVAQSTSCASFQKLNLTKAGERKQHVSTSKRRFKRRGRWVCATRASASNDFVEQQQQQQQQQQHEQLKVNTSSKAHKKKYISSVATRSTTSASAVEMLVLTEQDNATKSNFFNTKDKKNVTKSNHTYNFYSYSYSTKMVGELPIDCVSAEKLDISQEHRRVSELFVRIRDDDSS